MLAAPFVAGYNTNYKITVKYAFDWAENCNLINSKVLMIFLSGILTSQEPNSSPSRMYE